MIVPSLSVSIKICVKYNLKIKVANVRRNFRNEVPGLPWFVLKYI